MLGSKIKQNKSLNLNKVCKENGIIFWETKNFVLAGIHIKRKYIDYRKKRDRIAKWSQQKYNIKSYRS